MPTPYFFFSPLLAYNRAWAAFDWQTDKTKTVKAADYIRCFTEANAAPLAEKMPLVFNVEPAWLAQNEFIEQFKAVHAIFVLPASTINDPIAIELCKTLRKQGRHLALCVENPETFQRTPITAFDYLQFDAIFSRQELPKLDQAFTEKTGFHRIARAITSPELFNYCAEKRFDLCDSRFVTALDPAASKEPELARLKLLKLLSLVVQDADTHEIEAIFREEPKLSYNLLRLVNSVAVGAKTTIGSYSQAIAILGRRQLQRWLQLLIYANQMAYSNEPRPLMQLAAARGRQMELLLDVIEPAVGSMESDDTAFMTGIFSLLPVLLNLPISEILNDLPLHKSVRDALEGQRGLLGQLLAAIIAGESGDFSTSAEILVHLGITPARHAMAQIAAFYWASRINLE
jgi:EAL and modified HD-GYP domain-containing signal transduction protein